MFGFGPAKERLIAVDPLYEDLVRARMATDEALKAPFGYVQTGEIKFNYRRDVPAGKDQMAIKSGTAFAASGVTTSVHPNVKVTFKPFWQAPIEYAGKILRSK